GWGRDWREVVHVGGKKRVTRHCGAEPADSGRRTGYSLADNRDTEYYKESEMSAGSREVSLQEAGGMKVDAVR
ncbi:hypothetical protein, partial [Salmonella enterica]|uniref:hypothetical protein n=1 Tax=Salmonella enterica TaxID=28901 RepID=UPI00398C3629